MTECPYCHSASIRYSNVMSLHLLRSVMRSDKRYCAHCEKKWRLRSRKKRADTSFYVVAIPLALLFSLGIFRLTDQKVLSSSRTESFSDMASGNVMMRQSMGLQPEIPSGMASEANAALRKMNIKSDVPLFMNKEVIAKLKKLEANPQALSKLSGARREMAEKAIKFMKKQKKR